MSLWSRLFGRKPAAPPIVDDRRCMNEDWRAGDLAVCVVDTFFPGTVHDPRRDELLRVTDLTEGVAFGSNCLIYGLSFEGRPSHIFWQAQCFRKVRPAHEAADAEFCAEVRRRAKGRVGV